MRDNLFPIMAALTDIGISPMIVAVAFDRRLVVIRVTRLLVILFLFLLEWTYTPRSDFFFCVFWHRDFVFILFSVIGCRLYG